MTAELLAIGCLFAWSVISFVVGIRQYRKEKQEILNGFNIEELKGEFMETLNGKLQDAIDAVGESIGEIFTQPTVKKAFGIIGSQGGEARARNIAVDDMAHDLLQGPQFSAIKLAASGLGLDLDEYIEKHGALNTIQAANQIGKIVGIDLMNLDLSNLSLPGSTGGTNPYFRR